MKHFCWISLLILLCSSCTVATPVAPASSTQQSTNTPQITVTPDNPISVVRKTVVTSQPIFTPDLTKTADWAEFQATLSAMKTQVGKLGSPAPTFTPSPTVVSDKNRTLLIYGETGRTLESLQFTERGPFLLTPQILLYADGHLIIRDKKAQYWETVLAKNEIDAVFSKLHALGFFDLADDSSMYTDIPSGITSLCCFSIIIKATEMKTVTIHADTSFKDYYTQPLKEVISYLDGLSFSGLKPYQPEELMVGIREGNLVPGAPETSIPWPDGATPPDLAPWDGVLTLKGAEANRMLATTSGKFYFHLFLYKGKLYTATLRPIYPHECLVRHYDPRDDQSMANAAFVCEDWE